MLRFLLTSPKFIGTAELWYNSDNVLCKIDCTQTNMSADNMQRFKAACSKDTNGSNVGNFGNDVTIIKADIEISFEMFWNKYNKKINRIRCLKLWEKLTKTEQVQAYIGIDAYDKYLKKEHWRSKADAETYLKNKYWENEYK